RATPLIWKTVVKSGLKDNRNEYEDEVIRRLNEVLPQGVRVTLLADRGFGDQKLYVMLKQIGFHYVIRFREIITVADANGEPHPPWRQGRCDPVRQARHDGGELQRHQRSEVRARPLRDAHRDSRPSGPPAPDRGSCAVAADPSWRRGRGTRHGPPAQSQYRQ